MSLFSGTILQWIHRTDPGSRWKEATRMASQCLWTKRTWERNSFLLCLGPNVFEVGWPEVAVLIGGTSEALQIIDFSSEPRGKFVTWHDLSNQLTFRCTALYPTEQASCVCFGCNPELFPRLPNLVPEA